MVAGAQRRIRIKWGAPIASMSSITPRLVPDSKRLLKDDVCGERVAGKGAAVQQQNAPATVAEQHRQR